MGPPLLALLTANRAPVVIVKKFGQLLAQHLVAFGVMSEENCAFE